MKERKNGKCEKKKKKERDWWGSKEWHKKMIRRREEMEEERRKSERRVVVREGRSGPPTLDWQWKRQSTHHHVVGRGHIWCFYPLERAIKKVIWSNNEDVKWWCAMMKFLVTKWNSEIEDEEYSRERELLKNLLGKENIIFVMKFLDAVQW